jgi:Ca2+-transporting ATPase
MDMETRKAIGLDSKTAQERLAQHGPNVLFSSTPVRFWSIAREEVTEPMIMLLLVVGIVYSI